MAFVLEIAAIDLKLSSVEVWAIWCCRDGIGPFLKVRGALKAHMSEYVPSAAGYPGFRDQGATSETRFVGVEIIKDFVNDIDGYVNSVSTAL